MLIKNGLVFTEKGSFEKQSILTEGGRISMILPASAMIKYSGEVVDAKGCYIIPGLTDIHLHGCAGRDFCEGTADAIKTIAEYELSQGVTSFCPATMTLPDNKLEQILSCAAAYSKAAPRKGCAELLGIHLEGPFISDAKKGAQKGEYIQKPGEAKIEKWQQAAGGLIRLVTIAPELEGAVDCIQKHRNIHFSIGHTACSYGEAMRAFETGADHVTHLYNAMPPFLHRETGVIGAAFDRGDVFVELICDGVHISPTTIRAAFKLFGEDRVVLISDSMEAAGMPDGEYRLGEQAVYVSGSKALLDNGALAGSVTPLYKCMLNAAAFGIPLEAAVKAATINPCRSIGADKDYGSIAIGKRAAFVLLEQRGLSIKRVILENE